MSLSIERWSNLACAGGVALADVHPAATFQAVLSQELDGTDTLSVTALDSAFTGLAIGHVLRTTDTKGVVREHRVSAWERTVRDDAVVTRRVDAVSPLLDLVDVGPYRANVGGVTYLDFGGLLTGEEWLDTYVLPWLVTRGIPYWSRGTWPVAMAPFALVAPTDGWTPLALLRQLETASGLELEVVRVGETGYRIDFVEVRGSSAPAVPVEFGRNLVEAQETVSRSGTATAVTALGDVVEGTDAPATMADNLWELTGSTYDGGPFWISLWDFGSNTGPVAFDGQLVGKYVRVAMRRTVLVPILATQAGTTPTTNRLRINMSAIVADTTNPGFFQIVENASGDPLVELSKPGVPRIARTITIPGTRGEANLSTTDYSAIGWNSTGGIENVSKAYEYINGAEASRYLASTPQNVTILLNGAHSGTRTEYNVKGGTAYQRFFKNEQITINGAPRIISENVILYTGSGVLKVTSSAGTYPDNAPIILQGNNSSAPTRPNPHLAPQDANFREREPEWTRFLTNGSSTSPTMTTTEAQMRSVWPFRVKYVAGALAQVNLAASFCVVNGNLSGPGGNWDGAFGVTDVKADVVQRRLPGLMLLGYTAPSTHVIRAQNFMQSIVPSLGTVFERVQCTYQMTADETFKAAIVPGQVTANTLNFQACRWVMAWLGTSTNPPYSYTSWANELWRRANMELLARSAAVRDFALTLRDLSVYAGYSVSPEQLVLGARINLADFAESPRIVGLAVDLLDPENLRIVLDSRPVSLTRLIASGVGS